MNTELQDLFSQGDADLFPTAGQPVTLTRIARAGQPGEVMRVTAVIAPAEVAWELTSASGHTVICDCTAVIRRAECTRRPSPGDRLTTAAGTVFELVRVTGWSLGTTWHADLTLRRA